MKQRWPIPPSVNGLDGEMEVMEDILKDPEFIKATNDLVPLISLAGIDVFDGMTEAQLRIHQQLILARVIMKVVYE
jgi:hypothetical protein